MRKLNVKFDAGHFIFIIFVGITVALIIFDSPKTLDAKALLEFNRDPKNYNVKLQILNQDNSQIAEFMVANADDDYKKMYGLMNLESLPYNQGMIFTFKQSQEITMWMKNTKIPLDMIFIDFKNNIINIKNNATPYSLEVISSEAPAKKVIEINGGLCKKLGIKVGQKIKY